MYYLTVFISTFILFFILTPGIIGNIPAKGNKFTVAIVHAILFSIIFFSISIFFKNLGKYKEGASPQFCERAATRGGKCSTTGGTCSKGKCAPIKTVCQPVTSVVERDTTVCRSPYSCETYEGRNVCINGAGYVQPVGVLSDARLDLGVVCSRDSECKRGLCKNFVCAQCVNRNDCKHGKICRNDSGAGFASGDVDTCQEPKK